jgi:hypothetical protein
MEEIWSDIQGYEGLYQVSNFGNVKGIKRNKILSPKKYRYANLQLCKNNVKMDYYIHRLVAQTFIPNQDNLPEINHIDGNKLNNHITTPKV